MIMIHEISNCLSLLSIPAASHVSSQWVLHNCDDVAHCNFSWVHITFDLSSMVGDHDMIHSNQSCHYIFSSAIFINFGYCSVSMNTCLCLVEKLCTIVLVCISWWSFILVQVKGLAYFASIVHIVMILKFTALMRVVCRYSHFGARMAI